ncbi:MAG: hypothetical protein WCC00_01770 [Candidatus Aminicenantales bacterium]
MAKDSDLREELLKQMDREADRSPNAARTEALAILAKDEARLRRTKRITAFSWILLAAAFLASGVTGALSGFHSELWGICSIIGLQVLLIIAVALTVSLSFKARTVKMKQIQAALADIQDQLKSMRQDKAGKA